MENEKKCRDCKWLNLDKKTTVGYQCDNPNITHKGVGYLKYKSSKACVKGFEQREDDGEWLIRTNPINDLYFYQCSNCSFMYCGKLKNYCPQCGAKMKGVSR